MDESRLPGKTSDQVFAAEIEDPGVVEPSFEGEPVRDHEIGVGIEGSAQTVSGSRGNRGSVIELSPGSIGEIKDPGVVVEGPAILAGKEIDPAEVTIFGHCGSEAGGRTGDVELGPRASGDVVDPRVIE